jgi:putative ABC transport system permease protein
MLVNDEKFRVVGILKSFGNSGDDATVSMPADTMRDLMNLSDEWDMIMAKVPTSADPSEVARKIEDKLRTSRGEEEGKETFRVSTTEEYLDTFQGVLDIITVFLLGIAGISLFVGGIGIANTMFTAVLERTQEIGVMKAIGARNKDIVLLFLFESGILGLVGGAIGVILGYVIAKGVEVGIAATGNTFLQADISLGLTFGVLAFSFVFGAIAGVIPAIKASKLSPTEALRYE